MLCGIELQEVSNAEGSQVVAVTRKQEMQVVTETVMVASSSSVMARPLADSRQLTPTPSSSRNIYLLNIFTNTM